MKICKVVELGVIGYGEALALQQRLVVARKLGAAPDVLLLCEHSHVVTLGRNGKLDHLRVSDAVLRQMGVEFHRTNRGGDITYHGPGQVVGYPILHLAEIRRDVVWSVRQLEDAMIRATAKFGIEAFRIAGRTGVWAQPKRIVDGADAYSVVSANKEKDEEKLAAIGVHISRWVTSHGWAYNVSTDLSNFDLIVPCGIADRRATSLEKLLGRCIAQVEVTKRLIEEFGDAFDFEMTIARREELDEWLAAAESELAGMVVG